MRLKLIILTTMAGIMISGFSYATPQYNRAQLQHFQATNKCPWCDLYYVIFYDANSPTIDGNHSGADLHGADLSNVQANEGHLNLSNANLRNTIFCYAQLTKDNFSNADFTGAVLYGANLEGADLYGAKLTQDQINQASNICNAILPNGSRVTCK